MNRIRGKIAHACGLLILAAFCSRSLAAEAEHYDLFHPVPENQLGPMVTDRPGQTNGPFTVPSGHLQIETGILNYTYDHGSRFSRLDVFSQTEFRVGLVPNGELALTINPFTWQRIDGITSTGFGDTTLQGKWTVWTDPSGNTALGLIPFVSLPTSTHGLGAGGYQGGMYFPFASPLPAGFGLGVMPGVLAVHDPGGGYHTQVFASINLSHPIVGNLSAFGEFAATIDPKHSSDWIGTVDFGLVWLITNNIQIDLAMNVGVTHAADDINPYLGFSVRF